MPTSVTEVLAFHEAGHALVAMRVGLRLRSVCIKPEDGHGCCRDTLPTRTLTGDIMNDADWSWAHQKALILLGGQAAERVYYLDDCNLTLCSQNDEAVLAELCCDIFGSLGPNSCRWLNELRNETDRIVAAHWKGICSLAELLLSRHHLSGDEAERAIRGRESINWD